MYILMTLGSCGGSTASSFPVLGRCFAGTVTGGHSVGTGRAQHCTASVQQDVKNHMGPTPRETPSQGNGKNPIESTAATPATVGKTRKIPTATYSVCITIDKYVYLQDSAARSYDIP